MLNIDQLRYDNKIVIFMQKKDKQQVQLTDEEFLKFFKNEDDLHYSINCLNLLFHELTSQKLYFADIIAKKAIEIKDWKLITYILKTNKYLKGYYIGKTNAKKLFKNIKNEDLSGVEYNYFDVTKLYLKPQLADINEQKQKIKEQEKLLKKMKAPK